MCSGYPIHRGGTGAYDTSHIFYHGRSDECEPCIRDLRLTVRRVLEALAIYPDRAELKREYPELEDEDISQALAFAAALVDDKVLPLSQVQ